MSRSKFFDKVHVAKEEREVEDVYNEGISLYFLKDEPGTTITHPYKCDGMVDKGLFLRLIIEYKYDEELHNALSRAKVLIQVIYYLKQFELHGDRLPNVVMVGDKDEVFVMHTNPLLKYLDEDVNWAIAPSNAYEKNPDMLLKISNDSEITPYVYDINETFSFKDVADKIIEIATNTIRKVRVTEHNISIIFDDFTKRVLRDSDKIAPNDLVGIFLNSIIDRNNCYQHPNNKNVLVCFNKQYQINGTYYETFFKHFEKEYSPSDKNKFTEVADRLIEDTKRRRSGEFYTPTQFTDYAHKLISESLGDDWKEKYVVWDCCWGTGNLTRDYRFNELYVSTLEQAELDCGSRYNKEATKFIFDFLNNDLTSLFGIEKLPSGLKEALKNKKPIIFFINPPYATTCNFGDTNKAEDGNDTLLNKIMNEKGNGRCSDNLYAQFMWHILEIKRKYSLDNLKIGLFSPTSFIASDSFNFFRAEFFKDFNFIKGVAFKASNFAGVSGNWGIGFSVWEGGANKNNCEFEFDLLDFNDENSLSIIGKKKIYNIEKEDSASKWVRLPIKSKKTQDYPQLTNAINYKTSKKGCRGNLIPGALGFFYNNSNNVDKNAQNVGMFTSCFSSGTGCSITEDNYERCISLFSARRLIKAEWYNWQDEYIKPNTEDPKWNSFISDCIVYSIFESKSQQSSLHNVNYEGKNWDIKNEFFFMSKEDIKELANNNNFDFTYNDVRISEDRYVYKKLASTKLSKEASDVLQKAIDITKKTFKYRELFNQSNPEVQVLNWDAGWYQIKAIAKEFFSNDLAEFSDLFKVLSDKMRPQVYELGFLK